MFTTLTFPEIDAASEKDRFCFAAGWKSPATDSFRKRSALMSMCSRIVLGLSLAVSWALGSASLSQAGSVCFSIHGQGIDCHGTFYYTPTTVGGFGGTIWQLTSMDGTFVDSVSGVSGTISGLVPGSTYTTIPSVANHDSFPASGKPYPPASYDNLLFPNYDSPVDCLPYYDYKGGPMDMYGVLFEVALNGGGTWMVNLWCNGDLNDPSNPLGLDYGLAVGPLGTDGSGNPEFQVQRYLGDGNDYQTNPAGYSGSGISFQMVPEPSSFVLIGLGAVALGVSNRRRQARQAV